MRVIGDATEAGGLFVRADGDGVAAEAEIVQQDGHARRARARVIQTPGARKSHCSSGLAGEVSAQGGRSGTARSFNSQLPRALTATTEMASVSPRKIIMEPRVTMKGARRRVVMMVPLKRPVSRPTAMPMAAQVRGQSVG